MKPVPNTQKIFQLKWSIIHEERLFLNQLSCSYCISNNFYDQPCQHFPLEPKSWTSKNSVTKRKRSKSIKEKSSACKKKKTLDQIPPEGTKKVDSRNKITKKSNGKDRKSNNKNNDLSKKSEREKNIQVPKRTLRKRK